MSKLIHTGSSVIPIERIQQAIYLVRHEKVMLDRDLARLYGVTTGNLNKAVKRNLVRFPADFMFQLTPEEAGSFQSGSLKRGQHFKYLPYAFTEQGVAMLSSVLRSERAVQVTRPKRSIIAGSISRTSSGDF